VATYTIVVHLIFSPDINNLDQNIFLNMLSPQPRTRRSPIVILTVMIGILFMVVVSIFQVTPSAIPRSLVEYRHARL
jgi:hypothetical protein